MDDLTGFATTLKAEGASPSTVANYYRAVRDFLGWFAVQTGQPGDPALVTPLDLAEYRRILAARGRPATVNLALAGLRRFFAWCAARGLVAADPAAGLRPVSRERRLAPGGLARTAQYRLLRAAEAGREAGLLALLLLAGLRVSEAVALRARDVALRERSGHVVVRSGKGGKRRTVPLNATARRMLAPLLAAGDRDGWLFPAGRGREGHVTRQAAHAMLARIARRAGVEGAHPHALRHSFAKALLDAGVPLDRVALLLGHSRLDTTARYTRPTPEDLEAAVERVAWE